MAIGVALGAAGSGSTFTWHDTLRGYQNAFSSAVAVLDDPRWGAVGDDSAENRTAIASLVSALPTTAPRKGATILVPPGIFRVNPASAFSPSISADIPALTIRGSGPEGSVLRTTGSTAGDLLSISNVDNVLIEDLRFDMNYPTRTAAGAAVALNNVKHAVIRNCHFPNQSDIPIALYRCEDVTVENCWAGNLRLGFVRVQDPGAGGTTRKIWMDNNDVEDWQKADIGGHAAFQLHGTSTGLIEDVWARSNHLSSPKTSGTLVGLGFDFCNNAHIENNRLKFSGCGEGIACTGSNFGIARNHVSGGNAAGIVLWQESFALNRRFSLLDNMTWDQAQGIAITWSANNQFWEEVHLSGNHGWDSFTRDGIGGGPAKQSYGFQTYFDGGPFTGCGFRRSTAHDNFWHGNGNAAYNLASVTPQIVVERNWTTATTRD